MKTILRQLARQAGVVRVMQSESTTTPTTGTRGQIESTHAGNSGAEAQLPATSAVPRSSAAAEEYVPSTPSTSHKAYFDSVQQIFGVDYRRYLEEHYFPTSGPNYLNTGVPAPLDLAYPGYMVSPYDVTAPGLICSPSTSFSHMSVGYSGYSGAYQPNYYVTSPSPSCGTGYPMGRDMTPT